MRPQQLAQQFVSNRIILIVLCWLLFISCTTQQSQTTASPVITPPSTPQASSFATDVGPSSNASRTRFSSPPLAATTKLPIPSEKIVTLDEQQTEQPKILPKKFPEKSPDTQVVDTKQTTVATETPIDQSPLSQAPAEAPVEAPEQVAAQQTIPAQVLPLPERGEEATLPSPGVTEEKPKTVVKRTAPVRDKALDEAVRPLTKRDPFVRWDEKRREAIKSTQDKESKLALKALDDRMAPSPTASGESKDEAAKQERSIVLRVLIGVALLSFIAVLVLRSNPH